ncbi:hypothetical protein ACC718_39050, partial [Rhizobium ruizarguesonis]
TCTMIYGDGKFGGEKGAVGWLVCEENKGLACMFTMMNNARLAVGMRATSGCSTIGLMPAPLAPGALHWVRSLA